MTDQLQVRAAMIGVSLLAVMVGCTQEPSQKPSAGSGATPRQSARSEAGSQPFDPLTIRIVPDSDRVRRGKALGSRLMVENRSRRTVVDPGCVLGSGRYALVPVDDPDAELWVHPIIDCVGPSRMQPGYSEELHGPGFPARTKYGDPLPPGEYRAVLEIEGFSKRLEYPVTIE